MQLKYRGVQYQSVPVSVATAAGDIIGKYRGASLHAHHHTVTSLVNPPALVLKYRGISYCAHVMAQASFA